MMVKVWRDASGDVVNIGEWDYAVESLPVADPGPDGARFVDVATNPVPAGVSWQVEEVFQREDGGLAAAADYASLRRAAYPSLEDQLDAFWKGGQPAQEMRAKVLSVKARYPKPSNP